MFQPDVSSSAVAISQLNPENYSHVQIDVCMTAKSSKHQTAIAEEPTSLVLPSDSLNTPLKDDDDKDGLQFTPSPHLIKQDELYRSNGMADQNILQTPDCQNTSNGGSPGLQLISIGLGSLSTFMKSRGISALDRQSTSPRFSKQNLTPPQSTQNRTTPDKSPCFSISNSPGTSRVLTPMHFSATPCSDGSSDDLVMLLSTELLNTHLGLVQYLENLDNPPLLLYRDYNQFDNDFSKSSDSALLKINKERQHQVPQEADIIISPSTGVILTTLHALTQLYLPGHKPSGLAGAQNINSPVLERILQLSPRYERLYVLVCQSRQTQDSTPLEESRERTFMVDARTQDAMMSLNRVCESMTEHTLLIPHIIPSTAEVIGKWAIALASENKVRLLARGMNHIKVSRLSLMSSKDRRSARYNFRHEESQEEIHLRTMGLNPYAACLVLGILDGPYQSTSAHDVQAYQHVAEPGDASKQSSLSRFLEMNTNDRQALFEDMVGKRVLERLRMVTG